MTSTNFTNNGLEPHLKNRLRNDKPPPGFEYLFGGFLLLGLLYGSLADSFDILFEKKQQLGLVFAIALGFVNLTNLFRIERAPRGAVALLIGIVFALLSRLFDPSVLGLIVVFLPNGGFLIHDIFVKPAIFRSQQRRLLKQISNEPIDSLGSSARQVQVEFVDDLLEILTRRKMDAPENFPDQFSMAIQFQMAIHEKSDATTTLAKTLPLLSSSEELSEFCPLLSSHFENLAAIESHKDELKSIFDGSSGAPGGNRAALLCVFFGLEELRKTYAVWLPFAFDILQANENALVISWIEELLQLFPTPQVQEALSEAKISISGGAFLNVMARWIGPCYFDELLSLLESDDSNVLGTAAFIFGLWEEQGFLSEHRERVLEAFALVVQRIRSIHSSGDNIYADELVADFEQISGSLQGSES